MSNVILAQGPPPLTVASADAALDAIDMIAAAVRGVDLIDVTAAVRPLWRRHLASWYPHLHPVTRQWYANAPTMLAALRAQWAQLAPWQRASILQQWTADLPQMLWMLDPVLAEAQAAAARPPVRAQLDDLRGQASGALLPTPYAHAVTDYAREQRITASLVNHTNVMTDLTRSLMRSFSH